MWEQFEGVELTEEEVEQLMWEYNVVTRQEYNGRKLFVLFELR